MLILATNLEKKPIANVMYLLAYKYSFIIRVEAIFFKQSYAKRFLKNIDNDNPYLNIILLLYIILIMLFNFNLVSRLIWQISVFLYKFRVFNIMFMNLFQP